MHCHSVIVVNVVSDIRGLGAADDDDDTYISIAPLQVREDPCHAPSEEVRTNSSQLGLDPEEIDLRQEKYFIQLLS
jgi:hypothetical protein